MGSSMSVFIAQEDVAPEDVRAFVLEIGGYGDENPNERAADGPSECFGAIGGGAQCHQRRTHRRSLIGVFLSAL